MKAKVSFRAEITSEIDETRPDFRVVSNDAGAEMIRQMLSENFPELSDITISDFMMEFSELV